MRRRRRPRKGKRRGTRSRQHCALPIPFTFSSVVTDPNQATPSQAKPSQAKPNQTKPSQAKPNQTRGSLLPCYPLCYPLCYPAQQSLQLNRQPAAFRGPIPPEKCRNCGQLRLKRCRKWAPEAPAKRCDMAPQAPGMTKTAPKAPGHLKRIFSG
eukprot:gene7652-biopygen19575